MALLAIEDGSTPKGHFLILPSDRVTMLLKSIAVSELVLPYNFEPTQSQPQDDAVRLVERSLNKVSVNKLPVRKTSYITVLLFSSW